jgi:hypothetical protein
MPNGSPPRSRNLTRRARGGSDRCGTTLQMLTVAPASGDEHERRVRLLLLGKGAVLAHRFGGPRAAEMDESEQSPGARGANMLAAPFQRTRALGPYAARARFGRASIALADCVETLASPDACERLSSGGERWLKPETSAVRSPRTPVTTGTLAPTIRTAPRSSSTSRSATTVSGSIRCRQCCSRRSATPWPANAHRGGPGGHAHMPGHQRFVRSGPVKSWRDLTIRRLATGVRGVRESAGRSKDTSLPMRSKGWRLAGPLSRRNASSRRGFRTHWDSKRA